MNTQDVDGYGETYTSTGCYVTRYEGGRVVEAWGPYGHSEVRCSNARKRIRRNQPNRDDLRLHQPEGIPADA